MKKIDSILSLDVSYDKGFKNICLIDQDSLDYICSVIGSDFSTLVDKYALELRSSTISFMNNIKSLCVKNNVNLIDND